MKKKITVLILLSIILSVMAVEAQTTGSASTTGSVSVTVKGLFGQRLGGVNLFTKVINTNVLVATTDRNGQAVIKGLKPGTQQIGAQGRYTFRLVWKSVNVVAGKTASLTITYI